MSTHPEGIQSTTIINRSTGSDMDSVLAQLAGLDGEVVAANASGAGEEQAFLALLDRFQETEALVRPLPNRTVTEVDSGSFAVVMSPQTQYGIAVGTVVTYPATAAYGVSDEYLALRRLCLKKGIVMWSTDTGGVLRYEWVGDQLTWWID